MAASTGIPTVGKALLANRIIGSGTEPKYIAVGTGTATVVAGDTALATEVDSRVSGSSSRTTTTSTNDTYTVTGTFTCGATARVITECGLFDASTAGTLFLRSVLTNSASLVNGDQIAFTFNVQVTNTIA
jgi:hypothetical protein